MFSSRKGFVYTLIALILVAAIGTVFYGAVHKTSHESFEGVSHKVRVMDDAIMNLEKDNARAAYIAGFHSLIAMEQHVTSTGKPFLDPSSTFKGAFVNGSINGTEYAIMQDSTFEDYLLRVQDSMRRQGMLCNMSVVRMDLFQTDPWNLRMNYTLQIEMTDVKNTASWRTNRSYVGIIPIADIRDPLFSMNTYGRVQRTIRPTTVSQFVSYPSNDTTGFLYHFNNSYYIAGGRGPSILMRFANDTSDSIFGIESLVDTDDITAQGLYVNSGATIVDYLYFNATPAQACSIQNVPSKIILDSSHLSDYQLTGLDNSSC